MYTIQGETISGGARGPKYDPKKQKFEDEMQLLKVRGLEHIRPFFSEAEEALKNDKTIALDKKVAIYYDEIKKIMKRKLESAMGEENFAQLFKRITKVMVKELLVQSRERKEEQEHIRTKAKERETRKREEELKAEQARKSEEDRKKEEARRSKEWAETDKNDVIQVAFNTTRGSLNAVFKKAKLLRNDIKMEDVKRWRLEHQNKEKNTSRKYYNSWVGNKKKDEYQVDLFYFMDLKKKEAIEELRKESDGRINQAEANAIGGPAEDIARNFDLAVAGQPKARAKSRRQEILDRIRELAWEYESGLLVVDSFTKMVAVEPMKNRDWSTVKNALERAFVKLGKPASIYSDAEASMTSDAARAYFRGKDIVLNITLGHAPVAERMIGTVKRDIVHYLENRTKGKKWWEVLGPVLKEYNEEHVSRSTKMTPIEAARDSNHDVVKTNLEAIRKMDNPQEKIHVGDQVRVRHKRNFTKAMCPTGLTSFTRSIR